jgi:tetratricopeptide (TPR) repeat protein
LSGGRFANCAGFVKIQTQMNKKSLIISVIAVILSFAGGFILANALNRREMNNLQAELGRAKNSQPNTTETSETTLGEDEIRQKIAEADASPNNIEYQKSLAIALYRYADMKQESRWLPDVARILGRVVENNPKDYNAVVSLGNIYFDIAHDKKDNEIYKKARDYYKKALEIKPDDAETQTDLGLTYLMQNPADEANAVAAFQKSLKIDPKNEKALQNMAQAQIGIGNTPEAERFLGELKAINPNSEILKELAAKITEKKNGK